MFVVLHWKAREVSLVSMPFAISVVVTVISHRLGRGVPAQETAHSKVLIWLQSQIPILERQLIRKQPDRTPIESCPFFLARWPNRANVLGTKPGVLPQAIVSLAAGQPFDRWPAV